jgi:hypothetical protein
VKGRGVVVVDEVGCGVVALLLKEVVVEAVLAAEGGGAAAAKVETETDTDEEATDGVLAGFGLVLDRESSDEKRLTGLEGPPPLPLPLLLNRESLALADGEYEYAVALVLVTDGAEGCARPMEAEVSRIGAAADGIAMVFCFELKY